MRYYSIGLKIQGWGCLIVGGGHVALRKAKKLHEAGARLRVVAPAILDRFDRLEGVECRRRPFEEGDLEGMFMAVAATGDPEVNRLVAEACGPRGVLVNVVDAPELCQFVVPSMVQRGALTIALSTGGASPAFAVRLRQKLEDWLPESLSAYVSFLESARSSAKERIRDPEARGALAEYLASQEGYSRYQASSEEGRTEWLEELLSAPPGKAGPHE